MGEHGGRATSEEGCPERLETFKKNHQGNQSPTELTNCDAEENLLGAGINQRMNSQLFGCQNVKDELSGAHK